jgi:RNA-directed DNA polymerase
MSNNERQPSSQGTLSPKPKVKPKEEEIRADMLITRLHTEQWMSREKLMEEICGRNNLEAAYKKVCQNKGAPGIDNVRVEEFKGYLKENWQRAKASLLKGTYKPQPVREVEIPKANGQGKRKLGIPCLIDRLIQQAILQVLQKIWEPKFSVNSFGFRPGKSAHQAVEKGQEYVQRGYKIVVDIDLEKYFDTVNHDRLMSKLTITIKDSRVLKVIRAYLNCGIMREGLKQATTEGVPQGSPLSPLLSNIVLDELDKELENRGHKYCRYADDCNIYVRSERSGQRVIKNISNFITKRLKLKVNEMKSAVDSPNKRRFLGFNLIGKPAVARRGISGSSIKEFKAKVRKLTKRNWSIKTEERIKIVSRYLRGWQSYYGFCETQSVFKKLDSWIRHRLRSVQWQQWKLYKNRKEKLMKLGVSKDTAQRTAWSSKGPWRISNTLGAKLAMNKEYFRSMGLWELAPN